MPGMANAITGYWLAGKRIEGGGRLDVLNKQSGAKMASVSLAGAGEIDAAISAAGRAFAATRGLAALEREQILRAIAEGIAARRAEFVETLIGEGGKPRKYAEIEVGRTIDTFFEAARRTAEATGEYRALDQTARGRGYRAIWRRFPLGVVGCITPFNFPLNLVAHKVAPAIAAGCPFVVKPASTTPLSALLLGEMIAAGAWPKDAFSILPSRSADAERLATDERVAVLSFTGSAEVGWGLRAKAGRKRVVLELGGNAAAIVHGDADLAEAARRCAVGGFAQAGQSCISVQRIFAERRVYEEFRGLVLAATGALKVGDVSSAETDVGPMICEDDARRVEAWVEEAKGAGARVLCGGVRRGAIYEPTVIENAPPTAKVNCCEVFGPVVTLGAFDSYEEALARANDTAFGLQAGVFTCDIGRVWAAYETLDVGGVIINDVPTFRVENMPYGGVKQSGTGREGVRFAIEDYTEIKTLVMRD